jgi:hypothetical protein
MYDQQALMSSGGQMGQCWNCRNSLVLPPRIKIGDDIVMLNYDTLLYPHHVDGSRLYDFRTPVAKVVQHPRDPSIWGLQNLSTEKWVITSDDGTTVKDVLPQQSVTLAKGTEINFGTQEGVIRV